MSELTEILAEHGIECTGPGEVTCRGCRDRGWMSWSTYYAHLAEVIEASDWLQGQLAQAWDEGVSIALDFARRNDDGITLSLDPRVSNPYRAQAIREDSDDD